METMSVSEPPKRTGGGKVSLPISGFAKADIPMSQVETVDELVAKMKEAGVIA